MLKKIEFNKLNKNIRISYIKNIYIILLQIQYTVLYTHKNFKKFFKFFYYSFNLFWSRLYWKGRAFRVRKFKLNKYTFNFGHSHWSKFIYDTVIYNSFRIHRQNFVIFYSGRFNNHKLLELIKNVRYINRYTRRGLRTRKQCIKRRFGKISQVNSIFNR
jgi:hypothetical protein